MDQLPDVSGLPVWAQVVFILAAAVAYGVAHYGIKRGRVARPEQSQTKAEVAAVIVDSTALDRLTAAATALDGTLKEVIAVGKSIARASGSASRANKDSAKALLELAGEVEKLRDEIIRSAAR